MNKREQTSWRNFKTLATVLGALGVMTMVPRDGATQTPVELGVAQPPVITIVFDTSASMQWGGDGTFPSMDYSGDLGIAAPQFRSSWNPRLELNLPGSARRTSNGVLRLLEPDETQGQSVRAIGPCMLWHPTNGSGNVDSCQSYERPPRCGYNDCDYKQNFNGNETGTDFYDLMVSNVNFRLNDETGVPRHIQVKQILTGDLHLSHPDSATPGPGCWIVPRGRGGVGEQICCDEVENGHCTGDGNDQFMSFLDASDPVPHIQEVWDVQIQNGLMDAMASTAIFSAVMFDGYRLDGVGLGWEYPTTDIMAGNSPYNPDSDFSHPGAAEGTEDGLCSGVPCYDMGIFRFIGPTDLNLDEDEMRAVSSYVQDAILNAGFLFKNEEDLDRVREANDGDEITAPVYPYPLGKQVIGQSTPYGGVFHDLHQFYLNGQHMDRESFEENSESENPFATDPYGSCRGRHVVLFTDADEILEVPGGAGDELGKENLDPSFGYLLDRYPYMVSEEAIEEMIDASLQQMTENAEAAIDPRFYPRLHVLAVSNEEEIGDPVLWNRMLDKVGAMAEAGRTCAQYYLPPSLVPAGINTGTKDDDDNYVEGTCDASAGDVCLVPQNYGPFDFQAPGDDTTFQCEHPALMLTRNDRETLVEAFQLIFNEVARASGLSSRTRPSVTNYLDDDGRQGQYRIFSGLQVGGGVYWKGLLNRQVLDCNDTDGIDGESVVQLHEEMNRLRYENIALTSAELQAIEQNSVLHDRRRVFTSYPRFIKGINEAAVTGKPFDYSFGLFGGQSSDQDDFGNGEIAQVGEAGEANTRVPFTFDALRDVYTDSVMGGSGDLEDVLDYWGIPEPPGSESREERFHRIIDRYRARSAARYDRVLGGILNSNPVTVGPPDLDVPIDSYRLFRQRYANRPAMTYVGSVDGQLHAIYSGNPEVVVRESEGGTIKDDATGRAYRQREAWAYVPQLLHRRLVETWQAPFQLLDGSPVVQDVRLCHASENLNVNQRVCPSDDDGTVPAVAQWRTVLVQGLGSAPGYFAIDVTRPGGLGNPDAGVGGGIPDAPDPLVLWEFGPAWEQAQMKEMDPELYGGSGDGDFTCDSVTVNFCEAFELFCDEDEEEVTPWRMSFMGMSNAEAALGSVTVKLTDTWTAQRAVAIFSAGDPGEVEALNPECSQEIIGKALYVVDLQSGALIRRFVEDEEGNRFANPITGTPVLSATQPGQVSSRAFVGDSGGRLLRVDMTNPDPTQWSVGVFYDPQNPGTDYSEFTLDPGEYDKDVLGPAAFKPAVTTLPNRELVIIYGLGQRGETGGDNRLQAVISLRENRESDPPSGEPLWVLPLDPSDEVGMKNERLTGTPVVFNRDVFFTTYVEPEYQCEAGFSRIYRLRYDGVDATDPDNNGTAIGNWTEFEGGVTGFRVDSASPPKWFGPEESAMIRGVAVTLGPVCSLDLADSEGNRETASEGQRQSPQLVAAAGTADVSGVDSSMGGGNASRQGDISRLAVDLEPPQTRAIPLSWTVIGN